MRYRSGLFAGVLASVVWAPAGMAAAVEVLSDESVLGRVQLDGGLITIEDSALDSFTTNDPPPVIFRIDEDHSFSFTGSGGANDCGGAGVSLERVVEFDDLESFEVENIASFRFPSGDFGNNFLTLTFGSGENGASPLFPIREPQTSEIAELVPEITRIEGNGLQVFGVLTPGIYAVDSFARAVGQDRAGSASATARFTAEPIGGGSTAAVPSPSAAVAGGLGLLMLVRRRDRHVS